MSSFLRNARADIQAVFQRDPAAKNLIEVLLCYPGLHALFFHRIAHFFYTKKAFLLARLISHVSRFFTGIEIHPGATIGAGVFIDHGMGVVIGETTVIGDNVTVYQGVTLGGTGKEKGKRHPTIHDDVILGVGSKVLGNIVVENNSRIGAGAVVVKAVPPNCTVVGVPGRVVVRDGKKVEPLAHGDLPDPILETLIALEVKVHNLEHKIHELECHSSQSAGRGIAKGEASCIDA
jgi:serine O-acetyltransferase